MTVTERLRGIGAWSLSLRPDTPTQVKNLMLPEVSGYGHIVITPNRVDLGAMSDEDALALSRYTGIFLARDEQNLTLSGYGVNAWLGDGNKGRSFGLFGPGAGAGNTYITTGAFSQWVDAILQDGFLTEGTISSISGTYTVVHERGFFRDVLDAVCDRFGADWVVRPDFSLDVGTQADLFRVTPEALIVRHRADSGRDIAIRGVTGELDMTRDVEDWARRVIFWWDDSGSPTASIADGGVAEADVPFRGPTGGPPLIDRIVDGSRVDSSGDAAALAAAHWAQTSGVRAEMTLRSNEYDIGRDVAVGDNVYVFDHERGIFDLNNPVTYRGQTIYPRVIRCVGYTWPIRQGMGVWFRRYRKVGGNWELEWIDLTPYVVWEDGNTTVEVGAKPRQKL